jgi:hypothetical protein
MIKMLMNTGFRSQVHLLNIPLPHGRGSDISWDNKLF